MSDLIPPILPQKISPSPPPTPSNLTGKLVRENGKTSHVKYDVIHHGLGWQIWQGIQACAATVFTLGIGLAFQAVRNKWWQAFSGKEQVTDRVQFPSRNTQTSTKTSDVGTSLIQESKFLTPPFLLKVENDINALPLSELKIELDNIFNIKNPNIHPKVKTTALVVAERVAQSHIDANDFEGAMRVRMYAAQTIGSAPPISSLSEDLKKEDPKLGLYIQPIDTSLFKHQTLAVQRQHFEGESKPRLHVEGKISPYVRPKLQRTLDYARDNPQKFLKALPNGFCKKVTVTNDPVVYHGRQPNGKFSEDVEKNGFDISYGLGQPVQFTTLHFHGLGKVQIGKSYSLTSHYHRLSIDLDPGVSEADAAEKLTIILATLGLGAAASSSREVDEERIKMMQVFRAFYPREAYEFERSETAFTDSLSTLKERIIKKVPDMTHKFDQYKTYKQEVYPGQYIWAVRGLADEVRKNGGIGLMASINGDTFGDAANRFAMILNTGAMSTQDRYQKGIIVAGASPHADLQNGGAESVFTRLITTQMDKNPNNYILPGKMKILYDLDLVERVGYGYHGDSYGTKVPNYYSKRGSIIRLAEQCQAYPNSSYTAANEVCIRNRIPPQFIKGVLVASEAEKKIVLKYLRLHGLTTKDQGGVELINGKPVDAFIHIGNFHADQWK